MDLELDIYARVSRLTDERQRSEAGQVEDCEARVAERGGRPGEVHIDSGRSAWNPRVRRPAWERLMDRLEGGATGGVVVFDMARFSRRPIEGERLILAAERGLLVLDSEGEYDLTTANGRKSFRDQLNAAAYESDRLSTRVRRGKRVKASRGESNHSQRPFGFEQDGITRRPPEDAIVAEVAARVLSGENQDDIAADLNVRGVRTSAGSTWKRESVKVMLERPRYNGQILFNGVPVARMAGEPILDDDTWARLCTLFASRRHGRPNSDAYLGSGVLTCALCGHTLTGRPKNGRSYADGQVRRQYYCQPRAIGGGCGRVMIDQRGVDEYIGGFVVRTLSDPRHAGAVEAAAREVEDRRRPVLADLAEAEQLAEELAGRLGRQEIDLRRFDLVTAPLDKRIAALRAELASLDNAAPAAAAGVAGASREEWAQRWDAATVAEQRLMIRQALSGRRLTVAPARPRTAGRPAFNRTRIAVAEAASPRG